MQKTTMYAITVVIGIMVIISIIAGCSTGIQYNKNWVGETYTIGWDEVNVREEPNGKEIDILYKGEAITLTGRYQDTGTDDNAKSNWVEIQFDGATAWIARSAVNWMP